MLGHTAGIAAPGKDNGGRRHSAKSAVPEAQPWYWIIHLEGYERLGRDTGHTEMPHSLFGLAKASMGSFSPNRRDVPEVTDLQSSLLQALREHQSPKGTKFTPTAGLLPFNHFTT